MNDYFLVKEDFFKNVSIGFQVEIDKKALSDRIQRQEAEWRKERDQLIGRATNFEMEMKVGFLQLLECNQITKKNNVDVDRPRRRRGIDLKRNTNRKRATGTTR